MSWLDRVKEKFFGEEQEQESEAVKMAAVHTLRLYFTDTTDKEVTYSYKYFDNTKTPQQVKTFGELLIVNNSIFSDPPAVLTGAEYVTTDTTAINLSS